MAYCGRLAVEKNIDAFLNLKIPGTKLVIGDGPQRAALAARHPDVKFAGYRFGDELASMVGSADVLVFPSLTDTFGLAMIEALACGVPVAAFPVPGPIDVIEQGVTGVLHEDLAAAVRSALQLDRGVCARARGGIHMGGGHRAIPDRARADPAGAAINTSRPPRFGYYRRILARSQASGPETPTDGNR